MYLEFRAFTMVTTVDIFVPFIMNQELEKELQTILLGNSRRIEVSGLSIEMNLRMNSSSSVSCCFY